MAGLTTASLVSLYEPPGSLYEPDTFPIPSASESKLARYLGLPSLPTLTLVALLALAFFSISFLVFLNTSQTFVLTTLLGVPLASVGSVTGDLILADECLSLVLVLVYGALIDRAGVRGVAVWGCAVIGVALVGFVNARNVYYQLISMRLVYATGASALVCSLTAGLSILSSLPSASSATSTVGSASTANPVNPSRPTPAAAYAYTQSGFATLDERTSLLHGEERSRRALGGDDVSGNNDEEAAREREAREEQQSSNNTGAKFAGIIGFAAGCGALLGVFGYLRLPPLLATLFPSPTGSDEISLERALRFTFYIVATIAFSQALFLFLAFKFPTVPLPNSPASTTSIDSSADADSAAAVKLAVTGGEETETKSLWTETLLAVKDLGLGFSIAGEDKEAALAYSAGFTTRAGSLVVAAFVPLLINNYFLSHDLCHPASTLGSLAHTILSPFSSLSNFFSLSLSLPPSIIAPSTCRPAYLLASALTGVVQLTSLLLCPLLGSLPSSSSASRAYSLSTPFLLAATLLIGSVSFGLFAALDDPRWSARVGIAAAGMGIAQAGGLVGSLGLVGRVRGRMVKKKGREVGGAVSGGYSFCGGLGILIVGQLGGRLFDGVSPSAPFVIIAVTDGFVGLFAALVGFLESKKERRRERRERRED